MGLIQEFKEFALKGNVVDMAVGVVIGSAFGKIVGSFVSNIIMPPLNLLTAKYGVNFTDMAYKVQTKAPVMEDGAIKLGEDGAPVLTDQMYPVLQYGPFIQTVVDFLIIAAAIFLAVKAMNTLRDQMGGAEEDEAPTTKTCEYCKMEIHIDAVRCGHCTSAIELAS